MDEKKLDTRIGDVTQDKAEAERIKGAVRVLEGTVNERFSEFEGKVKTTVEEVTRSVVADALKKEREATLPPADPKRRALDCSTEWYRALRQNGDVSGVYEKFPDLFPMPKDQVRSLPELPGFFGDVRAARATMTTGSSGMTSVLPTPFSNEVQLYAEEAMPILGVLRKLEVGTGNGISGTVPVATADGSTCYITSQGSAPTDSTIVPSTFTYTLLKFAVGVPLSNQLAMLSVPAFMAFVTHDAGYAFGIKQHAQFATGTDSTQWMGLESASTTAVTSGSSVQSDLITTLFLAVPQMHRPKAVWCCNETTLGTIWKMKDAAGKREIPFDVEKWTIYGRPIYTNAAFTDTYLFFGDPTRYIVSSADYKAATIGFGNGYTTTSTDITYIYIGQMLDGGCSDTNAWRYALVV